MKYVGLETQQRRNNMRSVFLLCCFPLLVLGLTYIGCIAFAYNFPRKDVAIQNVAQDLFLNAAPWVVIIIGIWFVIAFLANTAIINQATGAEPLERKNNKRVYNLIENLCISCGASMPQVQIIEDKGMNAFASGINESSFTITLTSGLINELDDEELEGVIAHELTHIRNKDVRLMIVAIVFVGIFAILADISWRLLSTTGRGRGKGKGSFLVLVLALLALIGYGISFLMRFAISREREYMADAGGASLTKKPWALASALRKISGHSEISTVHDDSVQQLFIEHKKNASLFSFLSATHPPIEKRIAILENI